MRFLKKKILNQLLFDENLTIFDLITRFNKLPLKIALIVKKKIFFTNIITEGDIRRFFLQNNNLNLKIKDIFKKKTIVSSKIITYQVAKNIIDTNKIDQLPIVINKKIFDLFVRNLDSQQKKYSINNPAVIMAGGLGSRLGKLTKNYPKGMLLYKNKMLLEHIIAKIKNFGINNIYMSIYYCKKLIKNYFNDGSNHGIKLNYLEEKYSLGTIGSLKLLKKLNNDFFLFNCDVISDVNLTSLLKYHKKNKAFATLCIKKFKYKNPYGVVNLNRNNFVSFQEKPEINYNINAGIYIFKPAVINIIKKYSLKNFQDLIKILIKNKLRIKVFPIYEYWEDFGSNKNNLSRSRFNVR